MLVPSEGENVAVPAFRVRPDTTAAGDVFAISGGVPSFMQVLRPLLEDLAVESVVIASEQKEVSSEIHEELKPALGTIPIKEVPHVEFKQMTQNARAVIRTGEFTYYANIVIVAGIAF